MTIIWRKIHYYLFYISNYPNSLTALTVSDTNKIFNNPIIAGFFVDRDISGAIVIMHAFVVSKAPRVNGR